MDRPNPKHAYRRRVHRRRPLSKKQVAQRFRDMWSEAFGFGSFVNALHVTAVRAAMRDLAADEQYWQAIRELVEQQGKVRRLKDALKG